MADLSNRKLADQAGALAIGRLLAVLSESLVMLALVRLMGKAEVGALSAILLVYQTSVLLGQLGYPSAVMYFLPGRPLAERRAITWALLRALFGVGALTSLVLAGIAGYTWWQTPTVAAGSLVYLLFLVPLPLLDLPTRLLPNLLVAEHRVRTSAAMGIFKALSGTLSILLPIALGAELPVVAACMVASGALYLLVSLKLIAGLFDGAERVPSPVGQLELWRFSFPLGLTSVTSIINNRIDRYLILGTYTAARFAEYQAGSFQVPFISNIAYDVGTVISPRLRELFAEGKSREAIEIWRASIRKVALIVLPTTMVFVVAAEETMTLLFTSEYESAANVFRCYSVLSMGRIAAFGSVIVAAGRSKDVLAAAILSLVSNVAFSIPLLMWVGFIGPALGTTLSFIPMVVAYCYYIARAAKLPFTDIFPLKSYTRVLVLTLVSALPALAVKVYLPLPPAASLPLQGLVLVLTFALLGTVTREIGRSDWDYLAGFLKLRSLRRA